jgi:uncharacterized protein (TIGR04255 family)
MPFPQSRRVIYSKNPLVEVICQLRFPTVLAIEAELPAAFQEKIRFDYPTFDDGSGAGTAELVPQEVARLLGSQLGISTPKVYGFSSSDGIWKVTLNREFVAVACTKYRKWDDFRAKLSTVLEHLDTVYNPSYYTRLGLRYRNIIDREELDLKGVPWNELFQAHLAAELASEMADSVVQNQHQLLVELPNSDGRVRIVHGVATRPPKPEQLYVIDNDFFLEERVEKSDAAKKLDVFNKHSGGLFRSFIKDRLDGAMGPTSA